MENLAEQMGMSKDRLYTKIKTHILQGVASANGDGAASTQYVGIIPYKAWKVVGVGWACTLAGLSTTAEKCEWGIAASDVSAADTNYFGELTMDTTAGDIWAAGDMVVYTSGGSNYSVDALANAGTDTWGAGGAKLGVQQSGAGLLTFTKANVANSDGLLVPFFIIEVM